MNGVALRITEIPTPLGTDGAYARHIVLCGGVCACPPVVHLRFGLGAEPRAYPRIPAPPSPEVAQVAGLLFILPALLVFLPCAWIAEKIAGTDTREFCQCAMCQPGIQLFRIPRVPRRTAKHEEPGTGDFPTSPTSSSETPPMTPDAAKDYRAQMIQVRCSRCSFTPKEHMLANYADGPHVGETFLVCPTAVYRA